MNETGVKPVSFLFFRNNDIIYKITVLGDFRDIFFGTGMLWMRGIRIS